MSSDIRLAGRPPLTDVELAAERLARAREGVRQSAALLHQRARAASNPLVWLRHRPLLSAAVLIGAAATVVARSASSHRAATPPGQRAKRTSLLQLLSTVCSILAAAVWRGLLGWTASRALSTNNHHPNHATPQLSSRNSM